MASSRWLSNQFEATLDCPDITNRRVPMHQWLGLDCKLNSVGIRSSDVVVEAQTSDCEISLIPVGSVVQFSLVWFCFVLYVGVACLSPAPSLVQNNCARIEDLSARLAFVDF